MTDTEATNESQVNDVMGLTHVQPTKNRDHQSPVDDGSTPHPLLTSNPGSRTRTDDLGTDVDKPRVADLRFPSPEKRSEATTTEMERVPNLSQSMKLDGTKATEMKEMLQSMSKDDSCTSTTSKTTWFKEKDSASARMAERDAVSTDNDLQTESRSRTNSEVEDKDRTMPSPVQNANDEMSDESCTASVNHQAIENKTTNETNKIDRRLTGRLEDKGRTLEETETSANQEKETEENVKVYIENDKDDEYSRTHSVDEANTSRPDKLPVPVEVTVTASTPFVSKQETPEESSELARTWDSVSHIEETYDRRFDGATEYSVQQTETKLPQAILSEQIQPGTSVWDAGMSEVDIENKFENSPEMIQFRDMHCRLTVGYEMGPPPQLYPEESPEEFQSLPFDFEPERGQRAKSFKQNAAGTKVLRSGYHTKRQNSWDSSDSYGNNADNRDTYLQELSGRTKTSSLKIFNEGDRVSTSDRRPQKPLQTLGKNSKPNKNVQASKTVKLRKKSDSENADEQRELRTRAKGSSSKLPGPGETRTDSRPTTWQENLAFQGSEHGSSYTSNDTLSEYDNEGILGESPDILDQPEATLHVTTLHVTRLKPIRNTAEQRKRGARPYGSSYQQADLYQTLRAMADSMGMDIQRIDADGNCMFNAVVDQLRIRGIFRYNGLSLRKAAVEYLWANPYNEDGTHLKNFVENQDWDRYLSRMEAPPEWGDHIVLRAVAEVVKFRIMILTAGGSHESCVNNIIEPKSLEEGNSEILYIGLLGEVHFHSLQHRDWEDYLIRESTNMKRKKPSIRTEKKINTRKPVIAFAAMLAEGNQRLLSKMKQPEEEDDSDSDVDTEELAQYVSEKLFHPDHYWDPVGRLPTPHLTFLLKKMLQPETVSYLSKPRGFPSEEDITEKSEFGTYEHVGPAVEGLDVQITPYNYEYSGMEESENFLTMFIPKDTQVVSSEMKDPKSVDLIVDESDTPPGLLRLKPVYSSSWPNQLSKDGTGKIYLKTFRLSKTSSVPASPQHSMSRLHCQESRDRGEGTSHGRQYECIGFRCQHWPGVASDWIGRNRVSGWPSKEAIHRVIQDGCHVIPYQPPSHKESSELHKGIWEYSFAVAEKFLALECLSHEQRRCFHLLQVLFREFFPEVEALSAQNLKMVFFLALEDIPQEQWKINEGACILFLLDMLQHFTRSHNLPHYFIPVKNLFSHVSPETLDGLGRRLQAIRAFPMVFFMVLGQKNYSLHDYLKTELEYLAPDIRKYRRHRDISRSVTECFIPCSKARIQRLIAETRHDRALDMAKSDFEYFSAMSPQGIGQFDWFLLNILDGLSDLKLWLFTFYAKLQGTDVLEEAIMNKRTNFLSEWLGEAAGPYSELPVPTSVWHYRLDFLEELVLILQHMRLHNETIPILRFAILLQRNKNEEELAATRGGSESDIEDGSYQGPQRNFQKYVSLHKKIEKLFNMYRRLWNSYEALNRKEDFKDLMDELEELCDQICQPPQYYQLAFMWQHLGNGQKAEELREKGKAMTDAADGNQGTQSLKTTRC